MLAALCFAPLALWAPPPCIPWEEISDDGTLTVYLCMPWLEEGEGDEEEIEGVEPRLIWEMPPP